MRRPVSLFVSLATMTMSLGAVLSGLSAAQGAAVSIEVGNLYFCSVAYQEGVCDTTVTAGDTVTWTNVAGFHNVTECDETFATCPPAGGFESGPLPSGNSFSHTFVSPGVFQYYCSFHPTDMRGRITVQAAPTPTPTLAPTAAPSVTAAASTSAPSASPAAVPRAGGPAGTSNGTDAGALAAAALGGLLLLAAAAAGLRATGRARA